MRGARQCFDQANGFISEIANDTGEGWGQLFGRVDTARCDKFTQLGQAVAFASLECLTVVLPLAIDCGLFC